jgi:hypothetical protein
MATNLDPLSELCWRKDGPGSSPVGATINEVVRASMTDTRNTNSPSRFTPSGALCLMILANQKISA